MHEQETPADSEPAHDVLAAEAFAMPAPDPVLHHEELHLPEDPSDDDPAPHDVLAAEEFPMPAPPHGAHPAGIARHQASRPLIVGLVALVALLLVRRRRRARAVS